MSEKKFELLGREVTETRKESKDGKLEKLIYSMTAKDYEAIQAERGVTKEVKKVITECQDAIAEAAAKFVSARSLENHQVPASIKLGGSTNLSMEVGIKPHQSFSGVKPGTTERYETERFGVLTMTLNANFSRPMRMEGGLCDEIAKAHEEAFKKAKKK